MRTTRSFLGGIVLAVLVTFATLIPAAAQNGIGVNRNRVFAADYAKWNVLITTGTSASGAGTLTVANGTVVLPGGYEIAPFSTSNPITVQDGSLTETVTPSAVSNCFSGSKTCAITATYSNAHGAGATIISGTGGLREALTDLANYNGGVVYGDTSELLTLNTGSANSDTVANLLPANSFIDVVTGVVTTAITGTCTGWTLADVTSAGRFAASNTTLTAGTQSIGIVHQTTGVASATTGTWQAAAAKVRSVCATGAASAGAIRVRVHYHAIVAPTT